MSVICPTITAYEAHEYREQLTRLELFAHRIHIDLSDGEFTNAHSINPIQLYWPDGAVADVHMMFTRPLEHIETLVSLQPSLVIIHAEASGDLAGMLTHLQKFNIKAGIALLQGTSVKQARALIEIADYVLIFSGDLGYVGGQADLKMLSKVAEIKKIRDDIEIGWDGGASLDNVRTLAEAGIDVINVGSAIQRSDDPMGAFDALTHALS